MRLSHCVFPRSPLFWLQNPRCLKRLIAHSRSLDVVEWQRSFMPELEARHSTGKNPQTQPGQITARRPVATDRHEIFPMIQAPSRRSSGLGSYALRPGRTRHSAPRPRAGPVPFSSLPRPTLRPRCDRMRLELDTLSFFAKSCPTACPVRPLSYSQRPFPLTLPKNRPMSLERTPPKTHTAALLTHVPYGSG